MNSDFNLVDEWHGYNLFTSDQPLQQLLAHFDAFDAADLTDFGKEVGSAQRYESAALANQHGPLLVPFDRRGRRINQVDFHPAWHAWLDLARRAGLHCEPFDAAGMPGRWLNWAVKFYLHAQIEGGSQCPVAMTLGAIPILQREASLWSQLREKLLSRQHDPDDTPLSHKRSAWLGMGMTEKQGGSDVRLNETSAHPLAAEGRGEYYRLNGHKWFFSVPTADAHLVVARLPDQALGCFFVPRWKDSGARNGVEVQRLKRKVGNVSNASSEVLFNNAEGVLVGEPGKGVKTIIEMANYTRLTCALSSAGMMRQALVQALYFTERRFAFGARLIEQPLMQAVLLDLALESAGATVFALQLAYQYELDSPLARAWQRIMTPVAKFWICKRAVAFTGEAMEVLGGNGYVADGVVGRLFQDAPVNSIWEGAGNVMCLDVLRAIQREPQLWVCLLEDLQQQAGDDPIFQPALNQLQALVTADSEALPGQSRQWVSVLARITQAVLLRGLAPPEVSAAFIRYRLAQAGSGVMGGLDPALVDASAILAWSRACA